MGRPRRSRETCQLSVRSSHVQARIGRLEMLSEVHGCPCRASYVTLGPVFSALRETVRSYALISSVLAFFCSCVLVGAAYTRALSCPLWKMRSLARRPLYILARFIRHHDGSLTLEVLFTRAGFVGVCFERGEIRRSLSSVLLNRFARNMSAACTAALVLAY